MILSVHVLGKPDLRQDLADIEECMSRAVSPLAGEQVIGRRTPAVFMNLRSDGDAVTTFLTNRIDKVVKSSHVTGVAKVSGLSETNGITVSLPLGVQAQLLLTRGVCQVVDGGTVEELAVVLEWLELAGTTHALRKHNLLTCYSLALLGLIAVAGVNSRSRVREAARDQQGHHNRNATHAVRVDEAEPKNRA